MHAPRLTLCLLLSLACGPHAKAQVFNLHEGYNTRQITGVRLTGMNDSATSVALLSDLTLFVLLSPECPLSQGYSLTLNRIDTSFGPDLRVIALIPGKAYPVQQVKSFVNDYSLRFPVYIDQDMELTKYLHGTVTPEVILVSKNGDEVYRGAIDDWAAGLGKKKKIVTNEYLRNAIGQYLQKQPILVKIVKPTGCLINEY